MKLHKALMVRVSRCLGWVSSVKFWWSRIQKQGLCVKIFLFSERTMLYSHIAVQKFAPLISACACGAVWHSVTVRIDPLNARLHPQKLWDPSLDAWSTRLTVKLLLSGTVNWPQEWTNFCSWNMMVLKSILSRLCLYLKALDSRNEYSQEYWVVLSWLPLFPKLDYFDSVGCIFKIPEFPLGKL